MKRLFTVALTTAMVLSLAGCGSTAADTTASTSDSSAAETSVAADASTEASVEETVANAADTEKGEGVMTYADFAAADTDSEVTVETYVQAKQGWWEDNGQGQASIYTQDADGGYFFYIFLAQRMSTIFLQKEQRLRLQAIRASGQAKSKLLMQHMKSKMVHILQILLIYQQILAAMILLTIRT